MIREHKAPAGPRPANGSPVRGSRDNRAPVNNLGASSSTTPNKAAADGPMLSASSSNNHSLFSFGRNAGPGAASSADIGEVTASYDFLPSVSFDDLQSSLESASTDFKLTQFPSPTGKGSILEAQGMVDKMLDKAATAASMATIPQASGGVGSNITHNGTTTRVAIQPPPVAMSGGVPVRPGRSGSILRRPSTSSRQPSISSSVSAASSLGSGILDGPSTTTTAMAPPTAPAAMRPRRQSHYPPVSNANVVKPPRKSIGPGSIIDADYGSRPTRGRRPSLASNASERGGADSTRTSMDMLSDSTTRSLMVSSRASKAKSVQAPPRASQQANLSFGASSTLTPEQSRASAAMPRSPRAGGRGTTAGAATNAAAATAASKRMSVMPGVSHTSHATGLGARTISPTDTRRLKRLSMHHQPQSINQIANSLPPPPTGPAAMATTPTTSTAPSSAGLPPSMSMPVFTTNMMPAITTNMAAPAPPSSMATTADVRSTSRSPSMLPRKASTPSSNRTTPDISRKSYSSGLSIGSTTSYNTVRTSTGSVQPRLQTGVGSSRLPAPKALSLHSPISPNDDEDVPPVPAIPKVYESPKDSPAEATTFLDKRKSNLQFDASSIHSTSTGSLSVSGLQPLDPPPPPQPKMQRKNSTRKTTQSGGTGSDKEKKAAPTQPKKTLQPLRLPPITLGPLSTPTAAKIAALQDQVTTDRNLSPPLARQMIKTPTTPLTASKGSFFGRTRLEDKMDMPSLRSNSSVHHVRHGSPMRATDADATSSAESLAGLSAADKASIRPVISPFLSSSVPKASTMESNFAKRSKTGDDYNTAAAAIDTRPQQKPIGPRAPKGLARIGTKSPPPLSSPEEQEPPTPSSISSLRRKLSLSWKRGNSKGSINFSDSEKGGPKLPTNGARQDSMPPPRIPVSATAANLSSITSQSPAGLASAAAATNAKPPPGTTTYLESKRRKSSASSLNAIIAHDRTKGENSWGLEKKDSIPESATERLGLTLSQSQSHHQQQQQHQHAAQSATSVMHKILKPKPSTNGMRSGSYHHQPFDVWTAELDKDDMAAEDEMKKLSSRRKETEAAARTLDALRKRASPKERVSPQEAIKIAMLNIYERGEIVDYADIFFCGTQNACKVVGDLNSDVPNFGYDDERGDYTIVPGDHLAYRYEIVDVLGKGSFGQVVRCIDHKTGYLVAVKIIRNKKRFHQQALVEVNILQKLRDWDPKNKHSMVNYTQSFYFRGHLCISTELLDMNLYEFIKSNGFRGFSLKLIRRFTKQLLSSLNLLKQHKVIHCDLKPENILLKHPMHSEIKVIDFGSSCFENEKVYTYIQSRFYRSPEVILGMTYGMPIDMWSLGCILAELFTGVPIFPGENEQEQLACIMEVFGPPEKHLIEKSTRKKLFFDSMGKPRLTVSSKGRRRRPSSRTLQQVLKCDDDAFLDFLSRCLRWDPDRRMKPDEAIRHEFITGQKTAMPLPSSSSSSLSASNNGNHHNHHPQHHSHHGGGHHHGHHNNQHTTAGTSAGTSSHRSSATATTAGRDPSPIKRHNTISTPRPLPEPPGGAAGLGLAPVPSLKSTAGGLSASASSSQVNVSSSARAPRDPTSGVSPHKPGYASRRTSAVGNSSTISLVGGAVGSATTATAAAAAARRTSTGTGSISGVGSGLPRISAARTAAAAKLLQQQQYHAQQQQQQVGAGGGGGGGAGGAGSASGQDLASAGAAVAMRGR